MNEKRNAIFAWILFGLIALAIATLSAFDLARRPGGDQPSLAELLWTVVPVTFAFVGALIISRQPRNVIGLLLMLPGIAFAIPAESYVGQFTAAPTAYMYG